MEIFQYEFMRNALIAAVLVNIACGIVGTYVVVKKIVFISGGISHAAFGGVGLGYLLGINPILAAIPFSICAALSIGALSKKTRISEDTSIGIVWVLGMALGILFINLTPGYVPDLFSYLFGNIITVPLSDIYIMLALDIVIVFLAIFFNKEFTAISFDEEYAMIIGIPARLIYFLLLCIVALNVVLLIRVVGVILVIALLTIPASICKQFTYNIRRIILFSILIGIVVTIMGLIISFYADLASGATIIILLGVIYLITYLIKRLIDMRHSSKTVF
jgi:zinc transport system permease protein